MPTYEYECAKCHKGFELVQSMKDNALKVCPKEKCRMRTWGKGRVKRKVGAGAGFIFKGSGFYITDYRSEGYKAGKKSETAAGGSSDGAAGKTDGAKSEASKPEAAKSDSAKADTAKSETAKPKPAAPKKDA